MECGPCDPRRVQSSAGEGLPLINVIRTTEPSRSLELFKHSIEHSLESLILAQDERWRRA